ncbi:Uncharacterised protein [Mycobacteroides abscessus subsp. abscessus]|nr:Uncharacterised protein [Mycobacteroides abscessus]SKS89391.1 Uncharacterised protein [Mycobacteroides abscessus subsp. abscessus]
MPGIGIGVAVGSFLEGVMPGRKVDEPELGADGLGRGQCHPFGGVVAKRCPDHPVDVRAGKEAEQGDRQSVSQQQLVDSIVEVGAAFDENVSRRDVVDHVAHQPGTCRAVVANPDEVDGQSALSRCRA